MNIVEKVRKEYEKSDNQTGFGNLFYHELKRCAEFAPIPEKEINYLMEILKNDAGLFILLAGDHAKYGDKIICKQTKKSIATIIKAKATQDWKYAWELAKNKEIRSRPVFKEYFNCYISWICKLPSADSIPIKKELFKSDEEFQSFIHFFKDELKDIKVDMAMPEAVPVDSDSDSDEESIAEVPNEGENPVEAESKTHFGWMALGLVLLGLAIISIPFVAIQVLYANLVCGVAGAGSIAYSKTFLSSSDLGADKRTVDGANPDVRFTGGYGNESQKVLGGIYSNKDHEA
jgi:hypothetical protein